MWVCQGTAGDFLHALHAKQDETDVAILILSVARKDLPIVEGLIDGRAEIDVALGPRIGLFLFGETEQRLVHAAGGRAYVLPGARLDNGRLTTARRFFSDLETSRAVDGTAKRRAVMLSTQEIVPDLCSALDIDLDRLPCICALIRGSNVIIVTPVGDRLSFDALVRAAKAVRKQVTSVEAQLDLQVQDGRGIRERIGQAETLANKRDSNRAFVLASAESIERRLDIVMRPQLAAMFASGDVSADRIRAIVSDQAPDQVDLLCQSRRWRGIESNVREWRQRQEQLIQLLANASLTQEMGRQIYLESFEDQLRLAITAAMSESGLSMKRYRDYRPAMARISAALAVTSKVIEVLKKAALS